MATIRRAELHAVERQLLKQQLILRHRFIVEEAMRLHTMYGIMPQQMPSTRCSMFPGNRGKELVQELFDENTNPARLQSLTRVNLSTCKALSKWLKQNTSLHDSNRSHQLNANEKIIIFLFICSHGATFRVARELFGHSTRTISAAFHTVLMALLKLHLQNVALPSKKPPPEIRENPKLWPFFKGCVGAIDGTHISVCVPRREQGKWRNRKGWLSQNVLAACDFRMNFQFIWPGWEGSAHDSKVLLDAIRRGGFKAPTIRHYYLADAGYSSKSSLTLTPYNGIRYHLREQAKSNQRPRNKKELLTCDIPRQGT